MDSKNIYDNSKDALAHIMRVHGADVLLGRELRNFFLDYAPGVATLRKNVILSVYPSGAAEILKRNLSAGESDREIAYRQAIKKIRDTYGIEGSLAESVLLEFAEALGWKVESQTKTGKEAKEEQESLDGQRQEIEKARQDLERRQKELEKAMQDLERQRQEIQKERQDLERQKKSVSAGSAQPPTGYALKKGQRNFQFGKYDWRVLDIRDGKALLLAETILEKRAYHESQTSITWEKCALRGYLNGEFLQNFSSGEQGRIAVAQNGNPKNQWYGTNGGSSTEDRVFLLSIGEAVEYFGDSGQLGSRPAGKPWRIDDQYNSERIARDGSGEAAWWWLRSPGGYGDYAAYVLSDGSLNMRGNNVNSGVGVRPALWLNL